MKTKILVKTTNYLAISLCLIFLAAYATVAFAADSKPGTQPDAKAEVKSFLMAKGQSYVPPKDKSEDCS